MSESTQPNLTPRLVTTEVNLRGRTFVISKMPAMTSSYLAYLIMTSALPALIESKLGIPSLGNRLAMSPKDFNMVMGDALVRVSEKLAGGITPILANDGSFAVIGLEEDAPVVAILMAHSLRFSLEGFFDESLWKESGLFPQDTSEQNPET